MDTQGFWKKVKTMNKIITSPRPTTVEGTCGDDNIAALWAEHYWKLLNSVPSNLVGLHLEGDDSSMGEAEYSNPSSGADGIVAEHLKHASARLCVLLSLCFTAFLQHGILPDSLMKVILVPVIKDKAGLDNSMGNFMPVALACVVSKVLEGVLLGKMESYFHTADNQFGFKKELGTDLCIYALKEIVNLYRQLPK